MKISKIKINNFRVFEDITIELGKNITCIAGHNGVGKSTLLAILSNIGELKRSEGTHINGNAFRGEFSQVIHGDKVYDSTGEKCTIYFDDLPNYTVNDHPFVNQLSFRSMFQRVKKTKTKLKKTEATIDGEIKEVTIVENVELTGDHYRFRLIPIPTSERNTESKLAWPTYYLGLSRLFPIGESEELKLKSESETYEDIFEELRSEHKSILSSNQEYLESSSIEVSDTKKKKGYGIKTATYSEKMNSSGQDNLGQILMSVYSFELLKESQKDKYCGGLLLIDEIDATLHPVAQNNLIDFLYSKSKELDLQVVFTTHSLSLLEHILKINKSTNKKSDFHSLYFTNKRNQLEAIPNPDISYIKNDLMNTYSGADRKRSVPILTEDEIGRWFLKKITTYNNEVLNFDLNYIEMSMGWESIIALIKSDFSYYKNHLIILDPDINKKENNANLLSKLMGTRYTVNKRNSNIHILPGEDYIEKVFWEYVSSLEPNNPFYFETEVHQSGLNKTSLLEKGPSSNLYEGDEKKRIKDWFNQNLFFCDLIFDYWAKDNQQLVASFANNLKSSYNAIYRRS